MTRRRRLRTRTLVLSLAATLGGIVALPVHGAPDPLQQALRSWDAVIGDGRSGQPLPQQVIIVLAAPPAVSIEQPRRRRRPRPRRSSSTWTRSTRAGIWMSIQYRFVNALNAVAATVRPDQIAQLRAAPEVAGVYPGAASLPGGDGGQAPGIARARRAPARGRAAATARA